MLLQYQITIFYNYILLYLHLHTFIITFLLQLYIKIN